MAISQELAKQILENLLGKKTFTVPSSWYLGLSSSPITDGTIPSGAEPPEGIGYTRKEIPNTQLSGPSGSFTEAAFDGPSSVAYVTNAQTIIMDEITGGSEPTVQYFFLAQTSQNSNASGASNKVSMWGAFDRARKLTLNSSLVIETNGAVFEIINTN